MIDDNHEVPCLDFEIIENFEYEQKENFNWKCWKITKNTKDLQKICGIEIVWM